MQLHIWSGLSRRWNLGIEIQSCGRRNNLKLPESSRDLFRLQSAFGPKVHQQTICYSEEMHISLQLESVCTGQSPCTFELDNQRPVYDEVCAQIANHMILKCNGYYAFGFIAHSIFPQKNLQGIVIYSLRITRT